MAGDSWIGVVIGILKGVAFVYDIVTYVPWMVFANPQKRLQISNRVKVGRHQTRCFFFSQMR